MHTFLGHGVGPHDAAGNSLQTTQQLCGLAICRSSHHGLQKLGQGLHEKRAVGRLQPIVMYLGCVGGSAEPTCILVWHSVLYHASQGHSVLLKQGTDSMQVSVLSSNEFAYSATQV